VDEQQDLRCLEARRFHFITSDPIEDVISDTFWSASRGWSLRRPKNLSGLKPIVRAAPKLNVLSTRLSARTVGHNVMKLEEGPLCAMPPVTSHKAALPAIARQHRSIDLSRNVT